MLSRATSFFLTCTLALMVRSAELISCPDCSRSVSSRAVFCPNCGCPGEAIAEAAALLKTTPCQEPDNALRITTDGSRTGIALPVEMLDGRFAIAPLDFLLGATCVTLSFMSTNTPISYAMPEVAVDVPLVRFPISETNLLFWCIAPKDAAPAQVLSFSPDGIQSYSNESTARSIAEISAESNLVAVFTTIGGVRLKQQISDSTTWQKIQPKLFREQSRIFQRILQGQDETPPDKWTHPIFDALLKRGKIQEK